MFWGFFPLSGTAWGLVQVENASGVPASADALPTFRVYGSDSQVPKATGTATAFDTGNLTGCYKVSFSVSGSFARGSNYQVVVSWETSVTERQKVFSLSIY